jgi:hypothetical protein
VNRYVLILIVDSRSDGQYSIQEKKNRIPAIFLSTGRRSPLPACFPSPETAVLGLCFTTGRADGTKQKRSSVRTHLGPRINRSQNEDEEQLDGAVGNAAIHKDYALMPNKTNWGHPRACKYMRKLLEKLRVAEK